MFSSIEQSTSEICSGSLFNEMLENIINTHLEDCTEWDLRSMLERGGYDILDMANDYIETTGDSLTYKNIVAFAIKQHIMKRIFVEEE